MSYKLKTSLLIGSVTSIVLLLFGLFVYLGFRETAAKQKEILVNSTADRVADYIWHDLISEYNLLRVYSWGFKENFKTYDAQGQLLDEVSFTELAKANVCAERSFQSIKLIVCGAYPEIDSSLDYVAWLVIIGALSGVFIIAVLSHFMAGWTIRPIRNVTNKAKSIDVDNLSEALPLPKAHDDIYELTETFNLMLLRIREGILEQQRFMADASHELRTPLTAIEGHANLVRRWGKNDPEILEESIGYILNESQRLKRLTEQLLEISVLQNSGLTDKSITTANISLVVSDMVKQMALIHPEMKILSALPEAAKPLNAALSTDRLQRILLNLIDNAIKHSEQGSSVLVEVTEIHGRIRLAVIDQGTGIAEQEIPNLYRRFYRIDISRSRQSGGAGLGLSIVKEILDACGGEIRISSQIGAGTTVTVWLPRANQRSLEQTAISSKIK